jgi:conjugative relaxase-like TrwC/TraI family protein
MLSVASVRSASGAAAYFAADNYYTQDGPAGEWFGKGAEALGLTGKIEAPAFEALLQGVLPDGSRVGRDGIHRAGIDLTFSMPKSWSLIGLVGGDKRVISAYTDAVKATLSWAEKNAAQARIDVNGREQLVTTGKLVIGLFEHDTSRAQEPQAHVHAVVANVTQLRDGSWRALRNDKLWALNTLLNTMTMAKFRESVEALGYQVGDRSKHGNFEAAWVARNAIMAFSTRRQQILDKVAELRSRSSEALQAATLMTREDKAPVTDRAAMYEGWRATAKEIGLDLSALIDGAGHRLAAEARLGSRIVAGAGRAVSQIRELANGFATTLGLQRGDPYLPKTFPNAAPADVAAAYAVASAIRHLEQREAAFQTTDIYKAALDFGLPTTIGQVERAVARQVAAKTIVMGSDPRSGVMTTANAIATESRILDGVDAGRGAVTPILDADRAGARLQTLAKERTGITLNAGQESAGRLIFASPDRVVAIQGVAGAGKSSLLEPAARLFAEQGKQVMGLAVQNTLVRALERDTGIAAMTVARFVRAYEAGGPDADRSLAGHVIVVDEASMLANTDQLRLIDIANRAGADRLIFVGDRKQLGAVDAGKPFDLIQRAGVARAALETNVRARNDEVREAASAAQAGDVKRAVSVLGGNVIETDIGAGKAGAQTWLALPTADRDRTMIFASGRRLREAVNVEVQAGLRELGKLHGAGLKIDALDRINLTAEQLRYPQEYRVGHVVEVTRHIRDQGLARGFYTVTDIDTRGRVSLRDTTGKEGILRPEKLKGLSDGRIALFEVKERTIFTGDSIRWTANDHERGMLNADRANVIGIGKSGVDIETSTGVRITVAHGDPMLKRIDLAYAFNAHMAQGITADRGIVVMESGDAKLLTQQNFLVSMTRVRDSLTLIVDKADSVTRKLSLTTGEKSSALETLGKTRPEAKIEAARPVAEKTPSLEISKVRAFDMGI